MSKTNLILTIVLSIVVVVGAAIGIYFGLNAGKNKELTATIEISDSFYTAEGVVPNILVSADAEYVVYYKLQTEDDSAYTTTAPKNAGKYDIKVVVTRGEETKEFKQQFEIKQKELTIQGYKVLNREYDGTTDVTFEDDFVLVGVADGEDVTLDTTSFSASFANADAEENKLVTVEGISIVGDDVSNYKLVLPELRASITQKSVTVTGFTVLDKVYDGTTEAEISGEVKLEGFVADDENIGYVGTLTANFATSEIGEDIEILLSGITLTGSNAKNYKIVYPELTASIKDKEVFTITYTVNDETMGSIEGQTIQSITQGENGTEVTAIANTGYEFVSWSDGILTPSRTETNVTASQTITATFRVEGAGFNYTNAITSNSEIIQSSSVNGDGYIELKETYEGDIQNNLTVLNKKVELTKGSAWTLISQFKISTIPNIPNDKYFTFMGINNQSDGIFALQINFSSIRIYMENEFSKNFTKDGVNVTLSKDTNYEFRLISYTNGNLRVIIKNAQNETVVDTGEFSYTNSKNDYVVNCNVIGESVYNNAGQGASGLIYSLSILSGSLDEGSTPEQPEQNEFIIKYEVNNTSAGYINGETVQVIEKNGSGTEVTAVANVGYEFVGWSDGVKTASRTETNVTQNKNLTAIFVVEGTNIEFPFVNEKTSATIQQVPTLTPEGYLTINSNDTVANSLILTEKVKLLTSDTWKFEVKFHIDSWGSASTFTFMGVSDYDNGIYALQVYNNRVRFCLVGDGNIDKEFNFDFSNKQKNYLESGESAPNYIFTMISNGNGEIVINITDEDDNQVINELVINYNIQTGRDYVMDCNVIGNSFISDGCMGHSGTIYYLHITNYTPSTETKYSVTYLVNNDEKGSISGEANQKVAYGENATEVTAIPNAGYKFVKWSDGKLEATRQDLNITSSLVVTAIFESATEFNFINEYNDVVISEANSVNKDGNIDVTVNDTVDDLTKLSERLELTTETKWIIESEFMITSCSGSNAFTILGVTDGTSPEVIFALQFDTTRIRIYADNKFAGNAGSGYVTLNDNATLQLDVRYKFTLESKGDGTLVLNIEQVNAEGTENSVIVENQEINFVTTDGSKTVINCDAIGNSMYKGTNQGSAGTIYYLTIKEVVEVEEVTE